MNKQFFPILLISANTEKDPYPVFPLGLSYIGGELEKAGFDVIGCDLCFAEEPEKMLIDTIKESNPKLIGFSIRNLDNVTYGRINFYLPYLKSITRKIQDLSDAPIILGGSGYSLFGGPLLSELNVKAGVIGAGEKTFVELAKRIASGKDYSDLAGLAVLKDGVVHYNPIHYEDDLSSISEPARHIFSLSRYIKAGSMANIQTKRGCNFRCIYCTYPYLEGKSVRVRDPRHVVDEMIKVMEESGDNFFYFVDNIFNYPESHTIQICQMIIQRKLKVRWTAFFTPANVSEEFLNLAVESGCIGAEFGTESMDNTQLQRLGKSFTAEEVIKTSKACERSSIPSAHYLLLGGPGETPETLENTLNASDLFEKEVVICMIGIRISPHTPLASLAAEEGIISADDNLVTPKFYISPRLDSKWLLDRIIRHVQDRPNWIVPGLEVNSSPSTLARLRKMRVRGPIWSLLKSGRGRLKEK